MLKRYRDGEKLFEVGDRDFKFFVIKSGHIEIMDESGDTPKTVVVLGPGEFTGEVTQLTGTPSLVSGVARGDCEVYELSPDALRQLINHHPEVGDIILQAFIARRQLLHESENFTGLRVIGSRYSQDTFRIRDFLAKNRVPFKWLDLETDPQVNQLLKQFGVTEADTPVVAWGHKLLLRNPVESRSWRKRSGCASRWSRPYTIWSWSAPVPRDWRRRSTAPRRDCARWCWSERRPAARPAAACASRTTSAFRPASPAPSWRSAPSCRPTSSARAFPSRHKSPV